MVGDVYRIGPQRKLTRDFEADFAKVEDVAGGSQLVRAFSLQDSSGDVLHISVAHRSVETVVNILVKAAINLR